MYCQPARLFLALIAILIGPVSAEPTTAIDKRYNISYVWSTDAAAVKAYRQQVARILGPAVAKDLRVVANGGLYGVIYLRNGNSAGSVRVARVHSRLLRKKGLDAAAPVLAKDWNLAADDQQTMRQPKQALAGSSTPEPLAVRPHKMRDLEAAVEGYIKGLRRKGHISEDEHTAWSVYDFASGQKLVTINEETQFQAASLIKPFIAAAFFHRVENKELTYGPKSRRHMKRMIHYSNNPSTNWIMRQVGGPRAVQRVLKQNYPGIFRTTSIVEYIPAGGKTYRNKASARDYSRFLYALWNARMVGAREIKRLMSLPGPDRIYTGAESIPVGTRVLNKTGSTARLCADMGILNVQGLDGKRYPYTLIGIIEKQDRASNYSAWIRSRAEVIRDVSDIVYQGIARHHGFSDVL